MAAQWPLVLNRLLVLLPTLPGWDQVTVYDGHPTDPTLPEQYCAVGWIASTGNNDETAGHYTQVRDPDGFQYGETGTVKSQLVCSTAALDVPGQRAALFTLADSFEASMRTDRTLGGILSPTSTLDLAIEIVGGPNALGTALAAVLSLNYYTLT